MGFLERMKKFLSLEKDPPSVVKQVALCEEWIVNNVSPRKNVNWKWNSRELKHEVENWCNYSITNAAFINAAINLGFEPKYMFGPDPSFNMSFVSGGKANANEAV